MRIEAERMETEGLMEYVKKNNSTIPDELKKNANIDYFRLFGMDFNDSKNYDDSESQSLRDTGGKISVEEYVRNMEEHKNIFNK